MKKNFILAMALVSIGLAASAQCDTKTKWTATQSEFIQASGDSQVKDGEVTITTSKDSIMVNTPDGESMIGNVMDYACNWNEESGNISFKTDITGDDGKLHHAVVSIEKKEGKTTVLFDAADDGMKIKLPIDKYELIK